MFGEENDYEVIDRQPEKATPKTKFDVGDWVVFVAENGWKIKAQVMEKKERDNVTEYVLHQFPGRGASFTRLAAK